MQVDDLDFWPPWVASDRGVTSDAGGPGRCAWSRVGRPESPDEIHRITDCPERPSLSPQRDHFSDGLLLGLVRDEFAVVAASERQ